MNKEISLAEYLLNFLTEKNVKYVFLMTGGAISFVVDAFSKNKKIKYICVKHEQSAAMIADAYSRVTNFKKIGVTMSTSGPGATNLITGICCSWFDSIPTLHITGQVNLSEQRNKITKTINCRQIGFQETDIVSISQSITKRSIMLKNSNEITTSLPKLFDLSKKGRMGPVLMDIPLNLQREKIKNKRISLGSNKKIKPNVRDLNSKINSLISMIKKSKRLCIVVGGGIRLSGTEKLLFSFLKKIKAPVFTTWSGYDLIDYNNISYFNTIGVYGNRHSNILLQKSDLIIFLGSRIDTRITGGNIKNFCNNSKKVVVDIDKHELNKQRGLKIDLKINSDLIEFFKIFISKKNINVNFKKWLKECKTIKNKLKIDILNYEKKSTSYVNPYKFVIDLSNKLKRNAIIIPDDGGHLTWTMQSFRIKKGQRLFSAFGNSPMGYCIPASIGAKLASPKSNVVCIEGDGSFQINPQELHTIIENNLNIKIFIMNNDGYGIIRQFQKLYLQNRLEASKKGISNPNFKEIAKAYKFEYEIIYNDYETNNKLNKILKSKKASITEIMIDPLQQIYPKLEFGKPFYDLSPLLSREELKENIRN